MFRIRKNIPDSFKLLKARYFASAPTLPEFADVVIIGKSRRKKEIKKNLRKLFSAAKCERVDDWLRFFYISKIFGRKTSKANEISLIVRKFDPRL